MRRVRRWGKSLKRRRGIQRIFESPQRIKIICLCYLYLNTCQNHFIRCTSHRKEGKERRRGPYLSWLRRKEGRVMPIANLFPSLAQFCSTQMNEIVYGFLQIFPNSPVYKCVNSELDLLFGNRLHRRFFTAQATSIDVALFVVILRWIEQVWSMGHLLFCLALRLAFLGSPWTSLWDLGLLQVHSHTSFASSCIH